MRKRVKKRLIYTAILLSTFFLGAISSYFLLPKSTDVEVTSFFLRGDELVALKETLPKQKESQLSLALNRILHKPDNSKLQTSLPAGTKLLGLEIKANRAIINFNKKLHNYQGGSAQVLALLAQIVYTATAVPGIDQVSILVEGKSKVVLGSQGYVLERPLSRADFR